MDRGSIHNTWTMLRVWAVTGSEKSPPGGLTAPTILDTPDNRETGREESI